MTSLADPRTLEMLDFAGVRERVVGNTRTERGRAYAQALAPLVDFERVRKELASTSHVRELIASADCVILRCEQRACAASLEGRPSLTRTGVQRFDTLSGASRLALRCNARTSA